MEKDECVTLYKKGKELYKEEEYNKAIRIFKSIETDCLGNFEESMVHHYMGLCYSYLMKVKKSIKEFDLAIKFRPNYWKIYLDRGLTYYFHYNKNRLLERILRSLKKKNLLEKALQSFEKGILIENDIGKLWYYRGYMLELMDNKKDALKSFGKSIELAKDIKNYEKSMIFEKARKAF